jgi:hypothetical protein
VPAHRQYAARNVEPATVELPTLCGGQPGLRLGDVLRSLRCREHKLS